MSPTRRGEITKLVLLKLIQIAIEPMRAFAHPYKGTALYAGFMEKLAKDLEFSEDQILDTLYRLAHGGIIVVKKKPNGMTEVRLSEKGKVKVLKYNLKAMSIKRPKVWDEKWRVVIFDVPEEKKNIREYFREKIKNLGFVELQKSVYVHPFATDSDLEFLRSNYNIRAQVQIIIADRIENDQELRKKFGIK